MIGLGAAVLIDVAPLEAAGVVAYAVVVGVGIDLDHFPIARFNTGDWRAVRFCLDHPLIVFTDQSRIFETDEVLALQRLLSHAVLGGVLVAVLAPVDSFLATLSAVVLYAHIVSDLIDDNRKLSERRHPANGRP